MPVEPCKNLPGYGPVPLEAGETIDPLYLPAAGAASFGALTGLPTDNSALSTALSGKASTAHTHAQSDITNLVSDLAGKQAAGSYAAAVHTHVKADCGLGNVDNTSDANKPVSTAQASAIAAKQDLAVVQNVAPATGATQTFGTAKKDEIIALTHSATIAAQTIVFPTDANSQLGQVLRLFSRSIVTAITLTLNGNTIYGTAFTTIPASGNAAWQKIGTSLWARIQ